MLNFELHTKRLSLRPIELGDADEIFRVATTYPEITQFMSWNPPEKKEETEQFIRNTQKCFPEKAVVWAVLFNGKFCGLVGIEDIARTHNQLRAECAEIGYWMSPEFQGQGVMSEAVRAVLRFCFIDFRLHRIIVKHFTQNEASKKLIQKMGFHHVGTLREEVSRDGVWYNVELYDMLERELNA